MRLDDLVVEDRDVGRRGDRAATTADDHRPVRQPVRGLALPGQLHRRRADHDGRVGLIGLERRERLHRLAEPLLVGEERAPRRKRIADRRPLKRGELAAEHALRLRDRLGGARAGVRDRALRRTVLVAEALELTGGGGRDGDAVQREERVEPVGDPRIELELVAGGSRESLEGDGDVRVPQDLEHEALAGDSAREDQARRRRFLAVLHGVEAALGADAETRVVKRPEGLRLGGCERHEPATVELDCVFEERGWDRPRERVERPPAAAVVAGRADVADPSLLGGVEPRVELRAPRQVGIEAQDLGQPRGDPIVSGRRPFAPVPVEPAARQRPHGGDQMAVVREREHHLRLALRRQADRHVRLVGDGTHAVHVREATPGTSGQRRGCRCP